MNISEQLETIMSTALVGTVARTVGMTVSVAGFPAPVGAVADYDLIQAACDGVIVVVRPDHTDRRLCQKSLDNIPKTKFLGVLLNCVPDFKLGRNAGSDYYYYPNAKAYAKSNAKA